MIIYSCHNYLREKTVIKTIEISFKISSQIRPPLKSILNPVKKKSQKSQTLILLCLHNGAIVCSTCNFPRDLI